MIRARGSLYHLSVSVFVPNVTSHSHSPVNPTHIFLWCLSTYFNILMLSLGMSSSSMGLLLFLGQRLSIHMAPLPSFSYHFIQDTCTSTGGNAIKVFCSFSFGSPFKLVAQPVLAVIGLHSHNKESALAPRVPVAHAV